MFTGLIREIGTIKAIGQQSGLTRLDLLAPQCAPDLELGASLAVNGICLTVTRLSGPTVTVEAAVETRRVTTLRRWRRGDRVHLEPALRAGDPLGGHHVLGHVDGTGRVLRRRSAGRSLLLTVQVPAELVRYLLPKGSVAIDGVSLTVDGGPFVDRCTANIIPHTLEQTRLGRLEVGKSVNLEMDILVKAAHSTTAEHTGTPGATPGEIDDAVATKWTMEKLLGRGFRRHGR